MGAQFRFCDSVQRCYKWKTGNSMQSWGLTAGLENDPRYSGDYWFEEASLAADLRATRCKLAKLGETKVTYPPTCGMFTGVTLEDRW